MSTPLTKSSHSILATARYLLSGQLRPQSRHTASP